MAAKVGTGRRYKAQWEKFAQALASGLSPVDAGKVAGFKGAKNCQRNANLPHVLARVAELKAPALEKLQEQIVINHQWAVDHHLKIIAAAKANIKKAGPADYLKAGENLCKLFGLYAPEKKEITGKDGAPLVDLSKLTDEQLASLEAILSVAGLVEGDSGEEASRH